MKKRIIMWLLIISGLSINQIMAEETDLPANRLGFQYSSIYGSGIFFHRYLTPDTAIGSSFVGDVYAYELGKDPVLEKNKRINVDWGLLIRTTLYSMRPQAVFSQIGLTGNIGTHFNYRQEDGDDDQFDMISRNFSIGPSIGVFAAIGDLRVDLDLGLKYDYLVENMYRNKYERSIPSYQHQIIGGGSIAMGYDF